MGRPCNGWRTSCSGSAARVARVVLLVLVPLAPSCGFEVGRADKFGCHRAGSPGDGYLSRFTVRVDAQADHVWPLVGEALVPFGIYVRALDRGFSCTDETVADAQIVVEIEETAQGAELYVASRDAWTVPRLLITAISARLRANACARRISSTSSRATRTSSRPVAAPSSPS